MNAQAQEPTGLYDFLTWAEVNKKWVAGGLLAVLVLGFGIYLYRWRSQQKELEASTALVQLPPPLGSAAAENPTPTPSSAYLKVAEDYPGTSAADRALLMAAGASFAEGNFAQAQEQFQRFVNGRSGHPMLPAAEYGIAASLEAQGKLDEALAAYQNVATRYPRSGVADDAKMASARIHELKGQPEQALRLYEELSRPNVLKSAEALARKEHLLSKHPELAGSTAATNTNATTGAAAVLSTNAPAVSP